MHDSRLAVFGTNQAESVARCLGAMLVATMLLLLTTPVAQAEVIAEGDFTPDYGDSASDLPLYGNDPDGTISPAEMSEPVIIGVTGVGKLTIDTPSFTFPLVSSGDPLPSVIGQAATALGEANVTGFGSEWSIRGKLIVADEGIGFLSLTGGARVAAEEADVANPTLSNPTSIVLGNQAGSEGFVTIDGFGSRLDSVKLTIANAGNAVMTVSGRGNVLTRGEVVIGVDNDTVAKATFTGLGTRWLITENATAVGGSLDGTLTVGSDTAGGIGHSSLVIADDAIVQVDGATTINPRGRVELGGGTLRTIDSSIPNSGFVNNLGAILGDGWIEGGLTNSTNGELRNASAGNGLREQLLVTGVVQNDGLIDSIGGEMEFLSAVTNNNNIVARDALMRFRDGLTNGAELVLGGDTTVYGDIAGEGDIHTLSGSEAAIVGDLTFSASSIVSLAVGNAPGTLDIVGTADLAGSLLQLDYSAGIAAQPGDSYQVFSATGGLSGTFSNATAIADGLLWNIDYSSTAVMVTAAGQVGVPFGSDFNGDGIVDRLDLLVWQTFFPMESGATAAEGDADGDGDVDGNDFLIWQTQLGGPPAVAALTQVPEPSAMALLALGAALSVFGRGRRGVRNEG